MSETQILIRLRDEYDKKVALFGAGAFIFGGLVLNSFVNGEHYPGWIRLAMTIGAILCGFGYKSSKELYTNYARQVIEALHEPK